MLRMRLVCSGLLNAISLHAELKGLDASACMHHARASRCLARMH